MKPRMFDAYDEDLEAPAFDGQPFSAGEELDDRRSRTPGWSLVLVIILAVVGFYSLGDGSLMGAAVFFTLAAGVFWLSVASIRKELRQYMEYRHRL
jgi:hypothetical protein